MARVRFGKVSEKGRSTSGLPPSQFSVATQGAGSFRGWIIMAGGFRSAPQHGVLAGQDPFQHPREKMLAKVILIEPPQRPRSRDPPECSRG